VVRISSLKACYLLPMQLQIEFFTRIAAPWKRYCDECPMLDAHRRGLTQKEREDQAANAHRWQEESWDVIHDLLKQLPRPERRLVWHRIREATRAANLLALQGSDSGVRAAKAA
jgi:hypothetical protein